MSSFVETPTRTLTAGAALEQHRRVVLSAGVLAYAGATDVDIGTLEQASFASGDKVAVRTPLATGTRKMVAAGPVTLHAIVYGAANGKVDDSANANPKGIALEAAAADGDIIEVLPYNLATYEALNDDIASAFGSADDAHLLWSTADASNPSFVLALGNTNQGFHITDVGAQATDWNIAATTHPNVYIHSNTTPATDYLRLGDHDGTEADIDCVGGTSIALKLAGTEYASVRVTGLAAGTYVAAATPGTDQLTLKATGTAPASTGANVGHLYADFETDDDELFWLSGTNGTATH